MDQESETIFLSKGLDARILVVMAADADASNLLSGLECLEFQTHAIVSRAACNDILADKRREVAGILLHDSIKQRERLDWLDYFMGLQQHDNHGYFAPVSVMVEQVMANIVSALQAHGAARVLPPDLDTLALRHVLLASVERFHEVRKLEADAADREQAVSGLINARFELRKREEAGSIAKLLSLVCDDQVKTQMGLAELFLNAIEHGLHQIGGSQKERLLQSEGYENYIRDKENEFADVGHAVVVEVRRDGDMFRFEISDPGPGFDYQETLVNADQLGRLYSGRGLLMAKDCFDAIEYIGCGNKVCVHAKARN